MINKRLVLSFGHIPKHIGGKQSSGLSNAIWNITNSVNNNPDSDIEVILVVTDVKKELSKIEQTKVIGWTKSLILGAIFFDFLSLFHICAYCLKLNINYKYPLVKTIIQLVFFNKITKTYEKKVSILHSHGVNNFMLIEYLAKKYNKKIILTIHGTGGNDANLPDINKQYKIEKYVAKNAGINAIVFIASEIINIWVKLYGALNSKALVILNGIDTQKFFFDPLKVTNNNSNEIRLLTIGAISNLKGQYRVIEALKNLQTEIIKKYRYYIVGPDTENTISKLIQRANSNGISFEYLGYKNPIEISSLLHNVDYLIQPSSSEGFGLVFLESISCGTPVIIPRSLPLAIECEILNSVNSILIEDHSIISIKGCLENLTPWSYSRQTVASSVKNLSWNVVGLKYIELYNKTLR